MNSTSTKNNDIARISKGAIAIFSANIIRSILNIVTFGLVARYIGKEQFGYFVLSLTYVAIFSSFSSFGFPISLPAYFAKKIKLDKSAEIVGAIRSSGAITITLSLLMVIGLFLAADPFSQMIGKADLAVAIEITSPVILCIALSSLLTGYLRSFENTIGKLIDLVLLPFMRLLFFSTVILMDISFVGILYSNVAAFVLVLCVLLYYTNYALKEIVSERKSSAGTRELIIFTLPVLGSTILVQIILWSDTVILGLFSSAADVAAYNGGMRIARLLSIFGESVGFIMLPILARLYRQGNIDLFTRIYHLVNGWLLLSIFPFFWLFLLAPDQIMKIAFGHDFESGNAFLVYLGMSWTINVILGAHASILLALGKNGNQLFAFFCAATTNLALNLVLVPVYSNAGAAVASLIAYVVYSLVSMIFVYRHIGLHLFNRKYTILAICYILITIMLSYLQQTFSLPVSTISQLVILALAAILISVILAISFGYIRPKKLLVLREIA